jgi:hypothetical protein
VAARRGGARPQEPARAEQAFWPIVDEELANRVLKIKR